MKIAIIIPSFLRLELLQECLDSISKYWNNDYYVIVIDQNKSCCSDIINIPKNIKIEFIKTDFDIGALKARNIGIKRAKELGVPYTLIFADSMKFLSDYNFSSVIEFLEQEENRFLCGFNKTGSICTWECDMKKTTCFELDIPRRPIIEFAELKFQPVDLCRNIFLCKTDLLADSLYDEDRKLCDHEVSFWRWKEKGYKCYYLDSILFGYKRYREGIYNQYRERFHEEKKKMMKKYNLTSWVRYSEDLKKKWEQEKKNNAK